MKLIVELSYLSESDTVSVVTIVQGVPIVPSIQGILLVPAILFVQGLNISQYQNHSKGSLSQ